MGGEKETFCGLANSRVKLAPHGAWELLHGGVDILASAESFVVDHKSGFHLGCENAARTNGVDIGPPDTEFLFHIGVRLVWIEQVFILKTVRFIEKVVAKKIVK